MKEIGQQIGVNESRVSQLHARAIRRLKEALEQMMPAEAAKLALRAAILEFRQKPEMLKATLAPRMGAATAGSSAVVVAMSEEPVYASTSRSVTSKSASRNGLASQRQPLSSRKRSASVPATSPVTKMTRRASAGVAAAIAR